MKDFFVPMGEHLPTEPHYSPHLWHATLALEHTVQKGPVDQTPAPQLTARIPVIADALEAVAPENIREVTIRSNDTRTLELYTVLEAEHESDALESSTKAALLALWASGVDLQHIQMRKGRLVNGEELDLYERLELFGGEEPLSPDSPRYRLSAEAEQAFARTLRQTTEFVGVNGNQTGPDTGA